MGKRKEGGMEIRKKEGISRLFMLLEMHLPAILHQSICALLQELSSLIILYHSLCLALTHTCGILLCKLSFINILQICLVFLRYGLHRG